MPGNLGAASPESRLALFVTLPILVWFILGQFDDRPINREGKHARLFLDDLDSGSQSDAVEFGYDVIMHWNIPCGKAD